MVGKKRKEEEVVAFRSVTGDPVRIPLRRTPVGKTIEYYTVSSRSETIGEFLDVAIGACPSLVAAGLLHEGDPGRLIAMLHEFRGYRLRTPHDDQEQPIEGLGVQWLRRASKEWALSLFRGGRFLPFFALEAGCFLEGIGHGAACRYPEEARWRLEGHLKDEPPKESAMDDDKQWKKSFTGSLRGGATLLARFDEDFEICVPAMHYERRTFPAGTEARFVMSRCPLSEGWNDHHDRLGFLYAKPELLMGTWPYGAILFNDAGDELAGRDAEGVLRFVNVHGVIPWRWITAYVDRNEAVPTWKPAPDFEWAVGE